MKRVVSVSLGSSKRDHTVSTRILDEDFIIERKGVDGSLKEAQKMLEHLDGKVDALGLGGIDLYIRAGERRFVFREARKLIKNIKTTPVVDGSGLKDTLEKEIIRSLSQYQIDITSQIVLLVSGVDRPGMAEAFHEIGREVLYGDLIFALGIPIPIRSLTTLKRLANILAPVICQFPFRFLYPTGEKQNKNKPRFSRFYNQATIIAGDFHYIKKNLPMDLLGKIIITNTVTKEDIEDLIRRRAHLLITTTPNIGGRSFGTNVIEAVLVALKGKGREGLTAKEYEDLIVLLDLKPRIEKLYLGSSKGTEKEMKGG